MFARMTIASVILAVLTLPAFLAPAFADGPSYSVDSVTVTQEPTITTTGQAVATIMDTSTNTPAAGLTVHVVISWAADPTGTAKSSTVQQLAVKTDANGVVVFKLPFDQSTAKLNFPARHTVTVFVDGTSATNSMAYQVGTGLA